MRNAMILAAGRGERMRPLTDHMPKPLLNVRGKPLIQWHLEALRDAGFQRIFINVAHLGQQIIDALGQGDRWGLTLIYCNEPPGALETAGGIASARPWTNENPEGPDQDYVLVINGDVFTDWDPAKSDGLADDLRQHGGLCHLVMVPNPAHHPAGDFVLAQSPGPITGRDGRRPAMTFSGIGIYDPRMFRGIVPGTRAALAPLIHDMIRTKQCRGSAHHGAWSDVGTPERLSQLNQPKA